MNDTNNEVPVENIPATEEVVDMDEASTESSANAEEISDESDDDDDDDDIADEAEGSDNVEEVPSDEVKQSE